MAVNTTIPAAYYTASGFLEQAFACAAAADAYSARSPTVNTPTLNFLMGRAIELRIKAYLLSKGVAMDTLRSRRVGHDLEAALALAVAKGFNTEEVTAPTDQKVITVLNLHYLEKDFEYPQKSHTSRIEMLLVARFPLFISVGYIYTNTWSGSDA